MSPAASAAASFPSSASPPADAEARRQAIDPARSCIVQAPAGSGKTGLLIQRYLALLATVDEPEEAVAITFTRKAAAEMRERILAALALAATAAEEKKADPHVALTRKLARAALRRGEQRDWRLSENPSRLRIQTIDALCADLARQMPFLSRHGGRARALDDSDAIYEEAAIRALDTILSDKRYSDAIHHLLLHLDNDLPRLTILLQRILGKRDQWLRYLHAVNSREELEHTLARVREEHLRQLRAAFPAEHATALTSLLRYAAEQLQAANASPFVGKRDLAPCRDLRELPGAAPDEAPRWRVIADFLLTKNGDWRRSVNKNLGFPTGDATARQKKDAMLALLERLRADAGLRDLLHAARALPEPRYDDQDWRMLDALSQTLKIAAARLNILFAARGETDFIGIAEAALNALGEDESPTDLALYLDYQIRHILIDEFQDISVNQFMLARRLVGGWQSGDGRTLFLVGDPMQSIYGFREAEVGQFVAAFANGALGGVRLSPLRLGVNFRSEPGIVEWINRSFVDILPRHNDIVAGAVKFSPCDADPRKRPGPDDAQRIDIRPFFPGQEAAEDQAVAEIIQDLRARGDGGIALLVRTRAHLLGILPLLRQAAIPYQAIEIDSLAERQYILDLLALTRACLYPADRIAWLSILRAPWCGLTLDDLFLIVHQDAARRQSVWDACRQALRDKTLPADAASRLAALVEVLQAAFAQRQRHALRPYIETIWCSLGGPATLRSRAELDNVETYFRLLESMDEAGGIADIALLDEKVAALYALPDSDSEEAVQVMTIHKAKGLEFDHVILPQLGRAPRPRQPELLQWMLLPGQEGGAQTRPNQTQPSRLLLSPITRSGQTPTKLYRYLADMEREKERHEAARLLYVAATRARRSLHLLGRARLSEEDGEIGCKPAAGSLLAHAWPGLRQAFQHALSARPPSPTDEEEEAEETAAKTIFRLHADWRPPAPPPRLKSGAGFGTGVGDGEGAAAAGDADPDLAIHFHWAGETIKHIGTVAHRCLADLRHGVLPLTPALRARVRRDLLQLGVPAAELDTACATVHKALDNINHDETARWIFSDRHQEIKTEYALSGLHRGRLVNVVLDRTFLDESGVRWIIDYKTSRHKGGDTEAFLDQELERYKSKMESYGRIMRELEGEGRVVMLGLYFPLLRGWRAWKLE